MESVTVTKVFKTNKDKAGRPLKNKWGNYIRVAIKTKEYPDVWLGGFCKDEESPVAKLQEGRRYKVNITQNGEFFNFSLPTKQDMLEYYFDRHDKLIGILFDKVKAPRIDAEKLVDDMLEGEEVDKDVDAEPEEELPDIDF